jgi:carboxypeptidase A4
MLLQVTQLKFESKKLCYLKIFKFSGGADDWAKGGPRIKYTYTIELRDRGRYGFLLPAGYIQPTAKEAFAAIKTISEEINSTG